MYNKRFATETISVGEIIRSIRVTGSLGLPNFQRPSVWDNNKKRELLIAILAGDPVGSLLWVKPGQDLEAYDAHRFERSSTDLVPHDLSLVVDGQQRITAIFQVLTDQLYKQKKAAKTWAVDIQVLDSIRDGCLRLHHLPLSASNPDTVEKQATSGVIRASVLLDPIERGQWMAIFCKAHFSNNKEAMLQALNDVGPGLAAGIENYVLPVIVLDSTNRLGDVLEYFEKLNTKGQPLNAFDIAHSRMSNKGVGSTSAFDLRTVVADAIESSTWLGRLGVRPESSDDLMLPLQSLALRLMKPNLDLGATKNLSSVRDVSNGSVLALPSEAIVGQAGKHHLSVEAAVEMLERAAEFLANQCGVRCSKLLPQKSILLPLADQLWAKEAGKSHVPELDLIRWYYALCLQGEFHGRTKSAAVLHTRSLFKWADSGELPEVVAETTVKFVREKLDFSDEYSHMSKIQGAAVLAMIASEASDWSQTALKVSMVEAVELHHIVPESFLKKELGLRSGSLSAVANLTPISAAANLDISDKKPTEAMEGWKDSDFKKMLESHKIDVDLYRASRSKKGYEALIKGRAAQLKQVVIDRLGLQ